MSRPTLRLLALLTLTAALPAAFAAQAYPPSFEDARTEVYKTVGDTKLSLWIFEPTSGPKTNRPAIVFFFGGGWTNGSPVQFEKHCRYLASRGMVAITADYRVASRQQAKPTQCVADAKSAVRWLRANADRLGLDPHRIAAGGGSAGGHIAAATGTLPDFDEPTEDTKISSVPDALVLFNPALVLAPMEGVPDEGFGERVPESRMGTKPENISPAHHVKKGTPPTIIFHGKADTTVPYITAAAFERAMTAAGNRCELVGFEGQTHGFFNYGRGDGTAYYATVIATDKFLTSLGWLQGEPTLVTPAPTAGDTAPAAKKKRKAGN
jgi:acetyl esterase/lipase